MIQGDIKSTCLKNASLSQSLSESFVASITVVSESFENALQEVEHFRYPLRISREKIQSD